ncbi:MAG TPA: glutamate formiminotransferase [Candidatus Dormibacteraeota bacterium]|nr:glutamate formiminotransferase [Candidatus Dormibacteraeota bacterium]
MVWEAVPNFSEGRDRALVTTLGAGPDVLDVHADADHNRCVVTLADVRLDRLAATVFDRVALAVARIDLRAHAGVHPRVGAADVVPLVPLAGASLADGVVEARRLGERVWRELGVPVFFYGEAAGGRRLAEIRAGRVRPDLGDEPHPTAGGVCVGVRGPLVAYNLAFAGLSLRDARRVAAGIRALPGVQALAFPLSGGRTQVSMNLTRPAEAGAASVFERASELARASGEPELVGLCPAVAAGPGCDGGLLEARLAALAARRAAAMLEARGDAGWLQLAAEAASLRALAASRRAILEGAERVDALSRRLHEGGLATQELGALLSAALQGLRAAPPAA